MFQRTIPIQFHHLLQTCFKICVPLLSCMYFWDFLEWGVRIVSGCWKAGALNSANDPPPVREMPVPWHIILLGEGNGNAWRDSNMMATLERNTVHVHIIKCRFQSEQGNLLFPQLLKCLGHLRPHVPGSKLLKCIYLSVFQWCLTIHCSSQNKRRAEDKTNCHLIWYWLISPAT